jgi:hypothetical protein
MHFATVEHAQRAVALLDSSKLGKAKAAISEMLFEDQGRRLILKFDSSGVRPSDLVSVVFDVVESVSAARPLTREVSIPLIQE